jgi:signal transduction histidine kinase
MDKSIDNEITKIQQEEISEGVIDPYANPVIQGDYRTLDRLRNILIILNSGFVIIIPFAVWFMTQRTLGTIQSIHAQQRQFVSDVAHELRTPLSILSGEMEVALNKERLIPDYQQIITSGKQETDRLIELVENLLFLSRSDQRGHTLDFEKVDLTDVVGSVIASFQGTTNSKQITLHFKPGEEPTFVYGQTMMLRRLFFNIVHNAVVYTPMGGNVWISFLVNNKYLKVEIKDSGIGISVENQKKIFNRFFRADFSRSQTSGYGLGLAICKSIVELHRGKIIVRSTLGKGSIFTVLLPIFKN